MYSIYKRRVFLSPLLILLLSYCHLLEPLKSTAQTHIIMSEGAGVTAFSMSVHFEELSNDSYLAKNKFKSLAKPSSFCHNRFCWGQHSRHRFHGIPYTFVIIGIECVLQTLSMCQFCLPRFDFNFSSADSSAPKSLFYKGCFPFIK